MCVLQFMLYNAFALVGLHWGDAACSIFLSFHFFFFCITASFGKYWAHHSGLQPNFRFIIIPLKKIREKNIFFHSKYFFFFKKEEEKVALMNNYCNCGGKKSETIKCYCWLICALIPHRSSWLVSRWKLEGEIKLWAAPCMLNLIYVLAAKAVQELCLGNHCQLHLFPLCFH